MSSRSGSTRCSFLGGMSDTFVLHDMTSIPYLQLKLSIYTQELYNKKNTTAKEICQELWQFIGALNTFYVYVKEAQSPESPNRRV